MQSIAVWTRHSTVPEDCGIQFEGIGMEVDSDILSGGGRCQLRNTEESTRADEVYII
jgi:hypothetical protein